MPFSMLPAVLAVASAAGGFQAAPAASPQNGDVVVTARTGDRKKDVVDFVRALTPPDSEDPLARFDSAKLCPVAVGLNQRYDAAITRRMRMVATGAGIPVAAPDCRTNALVIIAEDKDAMIAALRREQPGYFRDSFNRTIEVPREAGPATAWHLSVRLDRNGVALPPQDDGPAFVTVADNASRISANIRPVLVASVVVIERAALQGLTTTQIGDYAAMRAYARISPGKLKPDADTILTVLTAPADSEVAASLTQWDLNYLKALYSADPFHGSRSQRSEIGQKINAAVAEEQKEK